MLPLIKTWIMKRFIFAFAIVCFSSLVFISCESNELKDVRALVASVKVEGDSLHSMKATVDGDTLLFSLKDARLNNGLMLDGDSVIINYIKGHKDTLRALVVTILPKAPRYIDMDAAKNDTLITAPRVSLNDSIQ